jgi:hypothetical protein
MVILASICLTLYIKVGIGVGVGTFLPTPAPPKIHSDSNPLAPMPQTWQTS